MPGKHLLTASLLFAFILFSLFLFSNIKWETQIGVKTDNSPLNRSPQLICPVATPEQPPQVYPVISPTNLMTQTITAWFHYAEAMTVDNELGSFSTQCSSPCSVTILLKPNSINYLEVTGKYKVIYSNGCRYGGYSLSTQQDYQGHPLEIEQVGGILYQSYLALISR